MKISQCLSSVFTTSYFRETAIGDRLQNRCFQGRSKFFYNKNGKSVKCLLGAKCYVNVLYHIQIVVYFNIYVYIFANAHLSSVHHTGIVYLMMLRCHVSSKHLVPNDQANKSFPLLLMFHYNGECQPHFIIFRFLYFHQQLLFIFFTVFISTCQEAFFFLIIICKNNIILPAAKTFWFVRFFL